MNANKKYSAIIDGRGLYGEISYGKDRLKVKETLRVHTDGGVAEFDGTATAKAGSYVSECPFATFTLTYVEVNGGDGFSERALSIKCKRNLRVYKIEKILEFSGRVEEVIDYKTFRCASASGFIRFGGFGVFTGFANPYFSTCASEGNTVVQSFEPSLILKSGEEFVFDCDFTGMYPLSGQYLCERTPLTPLGSREKGYMTRYHNPSSLTPLDKNEVTAFRAYTEHWLASSADKFVFEYYMYFSPVRPQPTEADEADYYRYIDSFKKLGGDIIVFQPLQRQSVPQPSGREYWEVYRQGTAGERIFRYARSKGLECGIYMGSAQENCPYCNSAMTAYADKRVKPEWKKTDANGRLSDENCIACDGFAEWYFGVQKNTVEKYGLGFWDWDPGPGNGQFCYNESHGHIAGKGGYKGFRNASALIGKIKKLRGGMYLQSFHGIKEYGVWGLKYFDQHEAYWEQDPGFFATTYPDFSADRITADGMRLQAQWNMNFRFLPATINHSLTNRMIQNCNNPEGYFRELFDFYGYKYALMSALATGASITSPIVPYSSQTKYEEEYFEFYRKWVEWARENFDVLKNCKLFGSQVGDGVEGYAHVNGERAFVFLFNANPVRGSVTFELGADLNLSGDGEYVLTQLYPAVYNYYDAANGRGVFGLTDKINVETDGYSVRLFELKKHTDEKLFGINGEYRICGDTLTVENAVMPYGSYTRAVFTDGGNIRQIIINGTEFGTARSGDSVYANVLFGGECDRQVTEWQLNGKPFGLLGKGLKCGTLRSGFVIDTDIFIRQYSAEEGVKLAGIAEEKGNGGNMHLAWSVPDRIYFVIPFTDCDGVEGLRLTVNGEEVPLKRVTAWAVTRDKTVCFIADIIGYVKFGQYNSCELYADAIPESTFVGGYLAYGEADSATVYDREKHIRVLDYSGQEIIRKSGEDGIKIIQAFWRDGNFAEHKEMMLCVKLNCPYDRVKRVLCSVPITIDGYSQLSMNTDRTLSYNPETGLWEVKMIIGERRLLIIDDCVSHIRAVDKDNFADDFILPLNWDF